ncbi:MAG TPA: 5-formyltetrahydrofolate cyclo-ligase [Devosia sp.]|jgi:5-formyltetrahydrofolate cyclo-ligase|uniref:5-formyltetrahydrofolate cyclo-ligase n=1 Tax=Devosia sp. TaxID=1871048 RepID=UPI002F94EF3B
MADDTTAADKTALRREARARREVPDQTARDLAADQVRRHFLLHVPLPPSDIIAGYWPIGSELDCRHLLADLSHRGHTMVLPAVTGRRQPLQMRVWEADVPLVPSQFGTMAPPETAPRAEPDLIIVPLLAFDSRGTRLGYGGGFYDHTLALMTRKPRLIGLAFSLQEVAHVPREAHDVPLDGVVTEKGFLRFGAGA